MTEPVRLTVPGAPVALERARKGRNGWYLPERSREFRERVQAAWMVEGRPRVEGVLAARLDFHMPRPKTHYRTGKRAGELKPWAKEIVFHASAPDGSNLLKACEDALNGCLWGDDGQIVECRWTKRYVDEGWEPHTTIAVWRFS